MALEPSSNVVSVGGTTLTQVGNTYTETAWSGSGGGVSRYEPKPAFQSSLTYSRRATPDVSYNANPSTGFPVYDTTAYSGQTGWFQVGGTSAGAPQWAAIQALGGSASDKNIYTIYNSPAYGVDFRDVTSGQAGANRAGPKYDLVTGVGSPLTTNFATTAVPDFTISASPNSVSINTATSNPATTAISVGSLNSFSGQVTLSATTSSRLTTAFDPATNPITGSGTSTLTITAPVGISAGTYTITVTGTSGSTVHTTTISIQVTIPDFLLTATPASQNIKAGGTGTAKVTVNSQNSYAGSVSLTASAPNGVKTSFNTNPVGAGSPATMTITLPSNARGTYTITITGTDTLNKALTHKTTITVTASNR